MSKRIKILVLLCCLSLLLSSGLFPPGVTGLSKADAQSLQATIDVKATQIQRVIPRTLYGTTVEWISGGNGLWNPSSLDPSPLLLTRLLKPSPIRFPGGLLADFYNWTHGVVPRPLRPTTPAFPGGPLMNHDFGTVEALVFAERVGGEILITANAGTGTAEGAADWVRFVNGLAGPLPPKTRVRYWEIGNELYNTGGALSHFVTLPPEEYVSRFQQFAVAMRAADPTIKIGAIGGENYGLYNIVDYPDWNRIVLSQAGTQIDFLAVHNAYAPGNFIDKGEDLRTVYSAMLAAPLGIARNLQTLSDQIDEFVPERASEITIAVTEWSPLFAFARDHRFGLHTKTLGSALYVASVLKRFIESPKVEVANSFVLTDESFMGWIGKWNGKFIPNAPYYALGFTPISRTVELRVNPFVCAFPVVVVF